MSAKKYRTRGAGGKQSSLPQPYHIKKDVSPPPVIALLCGIVVVSAAITSLPLLSHIKERGGSVWLEINNIVYRDVPLFFESGPFNNASNNINHDKYLDCISRYPMLRALPLALVASICTAIVLSLCIYYDSVQPHPTKGRRPRQANRRSHSPASAKPSFRSLSVKMVSGNFIAFCIIFLIVFRIYFNLSFL